MTLPAEAIAFLEQFTGGHTFQTFDDRPLKDVGLSRVLHSPEALLNLNRRGAGVFVMVNEGDGMGRKNLNVTRIRAHWADFDGQPLPARWSLEPSLLVESSHHKFHVYWILENEEKHPLDGAAFNAQQEALAHVVGSCPNDCKGLARVMRLPGFRHQKGTPFMTRILSNTGQRYTLAEVQAAFPLPTRTHSALPSPIFTVSARAQSSQRKYALAALAQICNKLTQAREGERNNHLNAAGFRVGQLIGGNHLESKEAQTALWQAAAAAGLPDSEIKSTLSRAIRDGMTSPDQLTHVGQRTVYSTISPTGETMGSGSSPPHQPQGSGGVMQGTPETLALRKYRAKLRKFGDVL